MRHPRLLLLTLSMVLIQIISADDLLTGTVIGTPVSVDYDTSGRTTEINTCKDAFDGDLSTFFASYDRVIRG